MPKTPTFGRYTEIPYDEMTPEQQEAYRFLVETRGVAGGPSKIWVHNPKLVKASAPLGAHFHPGHYSLTEREREIAVCIINSKWHSAYPTSAHERRGKEVGRPAQKVEAMLSGLPSSFADEREQIVYEMAISQQFSLGIEGSLRPRGQGARPCRHHRRDHLNGLLHQRLDDTRILRRARRGAGHGALSNWVRRSHPCV